MRLRLVSLWLLGACGPAHVAVPPLRPDLGPEQRVATYETYALVTQQDACEGVNCWKVDMSERTKSGTVVAYPEDLLPLVPADSKTAHLAGDARDSRATWHHWGVLSLVTLAAGTAIWAEDINGTAASSTRRNVVLGLFSVGVFAGAITWGYRLDENSKKHSALTAFDDELRRKLAVCVVDHTSVVTCESLRARLAPADAPPADAPPADAPP